MFQAIPMLPGDLYDSASRFAADIAERLAKANTAPELDTVRREAWMEMTSLGWPGLLVPEALGGIGGTPIELAAIAEGIGGAAVNLPIVSGCGLVPLMLTACPAGPRRDALLAGLAEGNAHITPITAKGMTAVLSGKSWIIEGTAKGVEPVPDTTHFILLCSIPAIGESGLFVIPADFKGLTTVSRQRIDGCASLDISLTQALEVTAALSYEAAIGDDLTRAVDVASVIAGAEQVGAMGALLDHTATFLQERRQFDVALASLQVLRHDFTELYIAYENGRALLEGMLLRWSGKEVWSPRDIAFTRLRTAQVSRTVALGAIQLHGGIGLTEELHAARLSRRLIAAEFYEGAGRTTLTERLLAAI